MRAVTQLVGTVLFFAGMLSAADLAGIWMGEVTGRNGEKQDLAFEFQSAEGVVKGIMFGDEFDLPVQDLHLEGTHITFSVTSINFYDGRRVKTVFAGTLTGSTLELTREQSNPENAANPARQKESKQTLTLKRLT